MREWAMNKGGGLLRCAKGSQTGAGVIALKKETDKHINAVGVRGTAAMVISTVTWVSELSSIINSHNPRGAVIWQNATYWAGIYWWSYQFQVSPNEKGDGMIVSIIIFINFLWICSYKYGNSKADIMKRMHDFCIFIWSDYNLLFVYYKRLFFADLKFEYLVYIV